MSDLFLAIVNLSLSASWLAAAVMGFRFLLKKAPKAMHVALWGLVALRLIFPASFESVLSLVPEAVSSGAVLEEWVQTPVSPQYPITEQPELDPYPDSIPFPSTDPQIVIPPEQTTPTVTAPRPTLEDTLVPVLTSVWVLGMCVMAIYALGSYAVLYWQVRMATRLEGNLYQSEFAPTAFVLGLLRPRIYVPYGMDGQDLAHVVAHERAHIARLDHWWKPLGYLLLTLHWFNPVLWLAYFLLCRDIELACDERVIRGLERNERADYSQTLLTCSIHEKMILACPVAFGQAGVKERVKNVLNYRKPGLWITLVTVLAMIISMVCFYAVPPAQADEIGNENQLEDIQNPVPDPNKGSSQTLTTSDGIEYTVSVGSVTPVGLRFSVDVNQKCTFLIYNYYWIERQTDAGWEALSSAMEDPCHMASRFGASGNHIFPGPTDTRPVDWSGKYGVLSPGTYRLCTVVFEGEDPVRVEFTIAAPGNTPEGQALQRYYDALNALLQQDSYFIRYTTDSFEDPTVDPDADLHDRNDSIIYEIVRSDDDYLLQEYSYVTDVMNDGFMIRDGIEYRAENEDHGDGTTPVVGWCRAPASRTEHFTFFSALSIWTIDQIASAEANGNTVILKLRDCEYALSAGPVLSDTVTIVYDEAGNLKQVTQITEFGPDRLQKNGWTSVNTLEVMDADASGISTLIELQDVNFCRDLIWDGAQPADESIVERDFVNTDPEAVETVSQAIDRAKLETDVPYSNVQVFHDAENQIWKVEFWVGYGKSYTESVYLNADGTTFMITHRGPLDI